MSRKLIFAIFHEIENQRQWFVKSTWHKTTSSGTAKSRNKLHSVLFLSRSGDSLRLKGRFYHQETVLLVSRNGSSWNRVLFFSTSKTFITLIINTLHVMAKISIFRHRRTMFWQISAVYAVRTAFLLTLFTYIRKCTKRRHNPGAEILSIQSLSCKDAVFDCN